jgi:mannose-1-phosphate guanylyltransferase/phosphomannomutase
MSLAAQGKSRLAVDGSGYFIFSDFQPVPDGMFALVRLLQCLATQQITFGEIVRSLQPFAWLHRIVPCPWDAKGSAMRRVNEWAETHRSNTVDGVKFFLDDRHWVLVRPDPDRAILHLCVEAPTRDEAEQLMREHTSWLNGLIQV